MVSNCVSQVSTMTTKHHVMCLFTLSILLPHSSYRGEVDSSSSSSVGEHLNQPLSSSVEDVYDLERTFLSILS
jgi:hypothetical protein